MKRTIILAPGIALALLLGSCQNEQKKAEKMIKNYVIERLNDPKSYESVSFSEIEKVKRPYDKSQEYKGYMELFDKTKDEFEIANISGDVSMMDFHLSYMKKYDSLIEVGKKAWNPANEYRMTHVFRGKNKLGGVVTEEHTYYIDTNFRVITYIE